ncbi:sulfite exporter TauE/SafE family protein [uncultured Corynebacterium sp.]|uniref:sulfite exporter TauE/SafE family protein n=1 Tax=uncultured Corynebacterium sp. TaxID=159447 RepID=UPI0025F259D4|nr:sulfite exporter TauE/SafE family protein [uncultured Corynebacterium sp.]
MLTVAVVLLVAVLVGAVLQRITGMGLGLVAGPVLSVALGPAAGVTVVNGLSIVNAANNAWAVRARTDWRRFRYLAGGLIVGSLPAAFVVTAIDGPWLLVTVGLLVMAALGVTMINTEKLRVSGRSRAAMIIAGVAGGFMSTVVGIAAPAFTIYSRVTRWDYRDFVATLHPVILVANAISFVVKIIFLTHIDTGDLPAWIWVVALATIFIGAWFGDRLNDRMSSEGMRRLATLLAFAGAATLLIQGAVQLVS